MPITYEPIMTTTLSSTQSTVTFSSIPNTYTDLVLTVQGATTTGSFANLYFNNDTGANYSRTEVYGDGSSALSFRASNSIPIYLTTTSGNVLNRISIMNYSNTTTFKSYLYRQDAAASPALAGVCLWRSTAAINRIDLVGFSGMQFASGSIFSLYGIKAA